MPALSPKTKAEKIQAPGIIIRIKQWTQSRMEMLYRTECMDVSSSLTSLDALLERASHMKLIRLIGCGPGFHVSKLKLVASIVQA